MCVCVCEREKKRMGGWWKGGGRRERELSEERRMCTPTGIDGGLSSTTRCSSLLMMVRG